MRASNTEYVSLSVLDPWLYRSPNDHSIQKVVYLKEKEYKIKVEKKGEEKSGEIFAERAANVIRIGIWITTILSIIAEVISFSGSSIIYAIKLFNIIDVISNLSKLNVQFGPNIDLAITFLENIKIPEIKLLAKLSPLKDSELNDPDINAYQRIPRGSRGKITTNNPDVFIASGQNFIISVVIILLWVLVMSLTICLRKRNPVLGWISSIYQFLIGMMFFDYLFICSGEIAFFNISALRNSSGKFSF